MHCTFRLKKNVKIYTWHWYFPWSSSSTWFIPKLQVSERPVSECTAKNLKKQILKGKLISCEPLFEQHWSFTFSLYLNIMDLRSQPFLPYVLALKRSINGGKWYQILICEKLPLFYQLNSKRLQIYILMKYIFSMFYSDLL